MKKILFLLFVFVSTANAQYWGLWHKSHNVTLGLSSDEKWAFFIQKNDAGIDNIYKVELKTGTVTPVTDYKDQPVMNAIVLFGAKPAVVYTRSSNSGGSNVHLYRVNVLTTDPPTDITPKDEVSSKKILGLAYNGRYVYYTSDQGPNTKVDTYRYDTQQYITEEIFPNDKNYVTLSWNKPQTHLLLKDPTTGDFYKYNIEISTKQKTDSLDKEFMGIEHTNYSLLQKYIYDPHSEKIIEVTTKLPLSLPEGAFDLFISPKDDAVMYVSNDGKKLCLYDISKKTQKDLTTLK